MNLRQGLATGALAVVIITSVALMPVSAEGTAPKQPTVRTSGLIAQAPGSAEKTPQDPARDLTYN